jgi:hypothetical protein
MKTMQTAGRGKAKVLKGIAKARMLMLVEYREARFEAKVFRAARPYRAPEMLPEHWALLKHFHNIARAALRNLNAMKAEVTP